MGPAAHRGPAPAGVGPASPADSHPVAAGKNRGRIFGDVPVLPRTRQHPLQPTRRTIAYAGDWPVLVVVDVRLPPMLLVGVLVGLVTVDHGGMVVLVVMAVAHVLPLLPMPQIMGDVGMLVLMHLGVMAVGVRHSEPPPACRVAACETVPRLPARSPRCPPSDPQPPDNRGPRRMPLDAYTVLSCVDATGG